MPKQNLSFAEMCDRFEVTARTLRYYEEIELLSPQRHGRTRLYGPREIARMTLILCGRRFGFSLEQVRKWLALYQSKGNAVQLDAFVVVANQKIAELIAQRAALSNDIQALQGLRDDAVGARHAPKSPAENT